MLVFNNVSVVLCREETGSQAPLPEQFRRDEPTFWHLGADPFNEALNAKFLCEWLQFARRCEFLALSSEAL